jgi:phosphatidylinositol glycan class B
MSPNFSNRTLLAVGAFLCVIAAWCTIGYHHPDEHFQIWEFANHKLGHIPATELPWEFPERMRPGLQPFMAFSLVKAARFAGIENPFVHVFLMRLLCGIAALLLYWNWCKWLEKDLNNPAVMRWMRLGILFFWLMPYLNVRFSSENTSAISFFGGLLLLLQGIESGTASRFKGKLVVAGLLLGLSFFFRYQMAFAFAGLGAWLLLQQRIAWQQWAALVAGGLLSLGIGFAADYWLYDEWVFAPYNYFFSNIMEGKAATFGVEPFWWYLTETPIALIPPLSIVLIVFFLWGIRRHTTHVFSWIIVPFLVAHSIVAHKEIRFLFPMVLPFFFFAAAGWSAARERFTMKPWMSTAFTACLWINGIALTGRILIPAKEMAAYSKFLWDWEAAHPNSTIHFVKKEPRKSYPLNMPFYEHPKQKQRDWYTDTRYQNDTTVLKSGDLMLFTEVLEPQPVPPPGFQMVRVFAYYPDWILFFNINNWQSRTRIWSIYRIEALSE